MKNQLTQIISTADMYNAFQTDKSVAARQYIRQNVVVRGIITYVGPDMYGLPSIEMSDDTLNHAQVLFVFHSAIPKTPALEIGKRAAISGYCVGAMPDGMAVIKNCKIV